MADLLLAKNIKKIYASGHQAVNGVSISIQKGECVGLVGESGSGKSTLARCLLMLEKISEGEIFLHDQPLHKMTKRENSKNSPLYASGVSKSGSGFKSKTKDHRFCHGGIRYTS